MGCLPCQTLQPAVAHLNDCYPPPKQLVQAGPDFKPLAQDLSKLIYFATNKPSQLAKIGEELEKRVVKDAKSSSGGYPKSRAALLISLAILKALITECKRDLSLFSRSAIRMVNASLDVKVYQKGDMDLEVVGRATSCFTSFVTFTDGNAIGVEDGLTRDYLAVLQKFGGMATSTGGGKGEKVDLETQSRMRLIGLAGLNGASASDALFSSNSEFARQIATIVPPLLANIYEGTADALKLETAKIEMDASPSPFFSEFSAKRPINDRRAPSLHAHIPGEKGPSGSDVLSAALRSLKALVGQCQVNQASQLLDAVFTFLDKQGWNDVERSCWLAERLTAFVSLQYRFVVPTKLVELLSDQQDSEVTIKQTTVLSMIMTILNSPVSLVGVSVSDLLNSLVYLIVRRVHVDERDGLLPPLVQCVSSLGTHIYYADQINDIVEEIALRIAELPITDKARPEILRVLIQCLIGVMTTAQIADEIEARATSPAATVSSDKGKGPLLETPASFMRKSTSRRNPVAMQVWQETLPLLCEATYAVREAYTRALLQYLRKEMPRETGPIRPGDLVAFRFCNALHAAIYTLAMSSCLGAGEAVSDSIGTSRVASPTVDKNDAVQSSPKAPTVEEIKEESGNGKATPTKSEKGVSFNMPITDEPESAPTQAASPTANGTADGAGSGGGGGGNSPPKRAYRMNRRVSLPLHRMNSMATLSSFDNVATPFDFAAIITILVELNGASPTAAIVTGLPLLLALDRDAGVELVRRPNDGRQGAWVLERKRAIRETVGIVWKALGKQWGLGTIISLAEKTIAGLPEPFLVPNLPAPPPPETILPLPEDPVQFIQKANEGESSSESQPLLDPEIIVSTYANCPELQKSTGRDAAMLARRFSIRWTVENAIKDSVERFSSANVKIPDEESAHFDIAKVLMTIENPSYQSFGKPSTTTRPIDVSDLREALGGPSARDAGMGSSPPSLVSTSGTRTIPDESATSRTRSTSKKMPKEDVKEVLKEIFKDKKRGGPRKSGGLGNGPGTGTGSRVVSTSTTANGAAPTSPDAAGGGGMEKGDAVGVNGAIGAPPAAASAS